LDWKVIQYLRLSNASSLYCRDIFTGIMGVMDARSTKKRAIVDFYEWYSEAKDYNYVNQSTFPKSFWKKQLFKFYERYICKNADNLITNNYSFAKGISQGVVPLEKFTIIRNLPDSKLPVSNTFNLRNFLPQNMQSKYILYYVGQLSFDRKLDTIILGMKELTDCVLLIQGTSHLEMKQLYAKELERSQASNRIFFLPPISDTDIINYASTADLGIFICDSNDNKMYHALPNKLFEYVFSGIPQVSSSGIEVNNIIKKEKIGLLFDAYSSQSFSNAVREILEADRYHKIKESVLNYRQRLYLENDFEKIVHIQDQESRPSSLPHR
jgi:glycosyltransferase involved in cell wall biosynthesis